jgi:alcohol dehydrogenase class IV
MTNGESTVAPQDFSFLHSARQVIHAVGGVERIGALAKERGLRSIVCVIDGFFGGGSLEAKLREIAATAGARIVFHAVSGGEADTDMVAACRDALAQATPDLIVAIGGGSTLDAAKVARMLLANPGPVEAIAGAGKAMQPHASLLVALPTTAGSGAEVSESAIISKSGAELKLIFRSPEMTPQIAILDPELAVSAPAKVTAESGFDAVTHAFEAYVSNHASPMTDPFAWSALAALARWLPISYREPRDLAARSHCLIAACQAAIAFNSAHLGLAHALSAPLGALFHVGHGLGNALVLPAVTAFNEPVLGGKGQAIAALLGAVTPSAGLARLRAELGLDIGLDQFVPDRRGREALALAAMKSGQLRMNPRLASLDDMQRIVEAARAPIGTQRPPFRE